jgi:hypothetical protein
MSSPNFLTPTRTLEDVSSDASGETGIQKSVSERGCHLLQVLHISSGGLYSLRCLIAFVLADLQAGTISTRLEWDTRNPSQ